MATDPDLNNSASESLEIWAPLHAWRALAQLRAAEAAQPLVLLFEQQEDDDWLASEFPTVFSMIGPSAIPALEAFLGDEGVEEMCRIPVSECLERMARDHPGERDACIAILVRQLDKFKTNGLHLNGFLTLGLMELGATEAVGVIRRAFSENQVDLTVAGDVEDVEIAMGLRTTRSAPRPRLNLLESTPGLDGFADDGIDDQPLWNAAVRRAVKVGRNDPCPCGSGKKFKKCCLN